MTGRHSVKRPIHLAIPGSGVITLPGEHGLDPAATREYFTRVIAMFQRRGVTGNLYAQLQRLRRALGPTT